MNEAVDINIANRVIEKMGLSKTRRAIDPAVISQYNDLALFRAGTVSPSAACRRIFETYLMEHNATENECLQAWALYADYKSMAGLYGLSGSTKAKTWRAGGLAAAS